MVKNYGSIKEPKFSTDEEDKAFETYKQKVQKRWDEVMKEQDRKDKENRNYILGKRNR
jgi:hypothetical protein